MTPPVALHTLTPRTALTSVNGSNVVSRTGRPGERRTSKPACIPRLDESSVGVRYDPQPSGHTNYTTTFGLGRVATLDSVRVESESTSAARPQGQS